MQYKESSDWTEALQAGMAKRWGYVPKTESSAYPDGGESSTNPDGVDSCAIPTSSTTAVMDFDVCDSSQSEDEELNLMGDHESN